MKRRVYGTSKSEIRRSCTKELMFTGNRAEIARQMFSHTAFGLQNRLEIRLRGIRELNLLFVGTRGSIPHTCPFLSPECPLEYLRSINPSGKPFDWSRSFNPQSP